MSEYGLITCKCCGCDIRSYQPCPHCGKPTQNLQMNNNYSEVVIKFDNKSTHTTNMCLNCANKMTHDKLHEIHKQDLAHMDVKDVKYLNRTIIGYNILKIEDFM
jgi:phage terminase large subunit GpA-like protein